jgi:8-oxo-dGTP pyrophosphatase MutT (NUDIX family)
MSGHRKGGRKPEEIFEQFGEQLKASLRSPLPGPAAQQQLAPRPRHGAYVQQDPDLGRAAAVLALLHPGRSDPESLRPHLILTRRTADVETHKGEVCLPGGALEPGEQARQAALREVEEEIGIQAQTVTVIGALTPVFVAVSGFRVQPFIGLLSDPPQLRPDPREVESALDVPLLHLLEPHRVQRRRQTYRGRQVVIPYFQLDQVEVWGATSMMLAELVAVVRALEISLTD